MSDNEKETKIETETEGTPSRGAGTGTDWEVVSLTASTYAASPPQPETIPDKSGNFVFPPSEHENLPIDSNLDQTDPSKIEEMPQEELEEEEEEEEEEELEATHEEEELIEKEDRVRELKSEISDDREEGKREKEERDGIEWVKKRVSCFYRHVKEANTYWSVFVAATLVGLVILGHRWQREKSQSSSQFKSGTATARG